MLRERLIAEVRGRRGYGAGTWPNPYKMEVPQSSVTDPIFARVDPNAYPMGGMGHFPEAFYLRYFEPQNLAPFPHRFSIMD